MLKGDGHADQRLVAFLTLGLVAFGLVMVYSATSESAALGDGDPMSFLKRQAVYALAYHYLGNEEEARDAAQEAFVRAYTRLGQLRDPGGFGAWLKTIATNVCRMARRGSRPTSPLEERLMSPAETDRWATRLTVRRAMSCLSEEARLTVSLYYAGSYSVEEIGATA